MAKPKSLDWTPRPCKSEGCDKLEDVYGKQRMGYCGRCRNLRTKYNLSYLEREDMGYSCEVCGSRHKPCVDHSHSHGHVRGILCDDCNVALGRLKDDPIRIERLAVYIRERGVIE